MQFIKKLVLLLLLLCIFEFSFLICNSPVHADQKPLSISAVVPPNASDYQFSFSSIDDQKTFSQRKILNYQITYGAHASGGVTTTTKLVADWSSVAPDDSPVLDYVTGSASTAYGNTQPIIDLTNRTITWTITSLPPGTTDQTITFRLRTTRNYTGLDAVSFTLHATMSNEYITIPAQTVIQTYQYDPFLATTTSDSTTSQPISTKTATEAQATTTPTPSSSLVQITSTEQIGITQSTVTFLVTTSKRSKISIDYGIATTSLLHHLATSVYQNTATLLLDNLSPNTTYYFVIHAVDQDGNKTTSEVYTSHTAEASKPPNLNQDVFLFAANGNVLLSDITGPTSPVVVLTTSSKFSFMFRLKDKINLTGINVVLRNKNVLGFTTIAHAESDEWISPMTEAQPRVYTANLNTTPIGTYELYVRIADTNKNILEQKVSDIKIIPPLFVYDSQTNKPIPDVRILLKYLNMQTKTYEPISPRLFGNIPNPSYTNLKGQVNIVLPTGKYQAVASTFGYDEAEVNFVIGPASGEEFPQIALKKNATSPFNSIRYFQNSATDFMNNSVGFINSLSLSLRFFNLFAAFVVLWLVILSFFLFTVRTHVSFMHLPAFFVHHTSKLFNKNFSLYYYGVVLDEKGTPLTKAHVEYLDEETKNIIGHASTNKVGKFFIPNQPGQHKLQLIITRDGYMPTTLLLHRDVATTANGIQVTMHMGTKNYKSIFSEAIDIIESILGLFYESTLILSIVIEFFFFSFFGFTKTLPFFLLSFLNILLWVFFLRERFERKFIHSQDIQKHVLK